MSLSNVPGLIRLRLDGRYNGAGLVLSKRSIANTAGGMLFASELDEVGRSSRSTKTPALARCAAIWAPIVPAPRTAALLIATPEDLGKLSQYGTSNGSFKINCSPIQITLTIIVAPYLVSYLLSALSTAGPQTHFSPQLSGYGRVN